MSTAVPTVLIVEDNPTTRKLLRITVESYGCDVREAADARTALASLDEDVDLIVLDLLLPDMDGIKLRERIREHDAAHDVPVIAVSGYRQRLYGEEATAAGFADRFPKPVEPSALLGAMQTWLPAVGDDLPRGTARVLLADDTDVQRKLTTLHLRDRGYEVIEARDGLEALEIARRERPDVVLTDILMPGLDGFDLCRHIAADPALAGTPVVLASSVFVEEADRELAIAAGATGYVTREPDMSAIIEAVRRALVDPATRRPAPDTFGDMHSDRLGRALVHQTAEHSALERELAQREAQLAILSGISETLATSADPATIMESILARCLEATGLAGAEFRSAGGAVAVGDPVPVSEDELQAALDEEAVSPGDDRLVIPVRSAESDLGAVILGTGGRSFTADQMALCHAVARQLCQAVALARSQAELVSSREETICRLATAVSMRDGNTADHTQRMSDLCRALAEAVGVPPERCELLRIASTMHDIGKVATPDAILLKAGPLTTVERAEIERHAEIGHTILAGSGSELLELAATIALSHHERWDGNGYPRGLRGEEIPLEGRIAAVADVYDALTSDRPYRPAMPLEAVLDIMRQGRGTHFDPAVIDAFLVVVGARVTDVPAASAGG